MDPTAASALRTGQILVGALTFGMVSFAAVAAVLAGQTGGSAMPPATANTLLIVLGGLAVLELGAYQVIIGPALTRQVQREMEPLTDHAARASFIEQRFLVHTLIASALTEGIGLFGAVIVLISGRHEAIAATAAAVFIMMFIFPTRERLERFARRVAGQDSL